MLHDVRIQCVHYKINTLLMEIIIVGLFFQLIIIHDEIDGLLMIHGCGSIYLKMSLFQTKMDVIINVQKVHIMVYIWVTRGVLSIVVILLQQYLILKNFQSQVNTINRGHIREL